MASSKKLRHGELAARLETFLKQAIKPGQRLLLALSGGLDSCVLLHLLAGLQVQCAFKLSALHVNHGISPNAGDWQQFCADLCTHHQISYTSQLVVVPRDSGLGIEAAARAARYGVMLSQPVDVVVLAHHQDDQAETLLLQLLRGAGVQGLAAMPSKSETNTAMPTIMRPLLDIPRSVLEQYAACHGLKWIEDESNLDLAYDRNFLRHHVLPELEKRFPASRATLARSASHIAEAAYLLDEMAQEDAVQWIKHGRLEVGGLRAMSEPRAKNLLRYWLSAYLNEPPSTRRLQDILRQLLEARAEARIEITFDEGLVHRYRGEAWFDQKLATNQPEVLPWHGESELPFSGGGLTFQHVAGHGISLAKLAEEPLHIRLRTGGERLRLHRQGPLRSLKNLFQEAGVPAWHRLAQPLIYWREVLVCIPGIGVNADWQASADEAGLVITWQRD